MLAVGAHALLDLDRQLARRRQHQHARRAGDAGQAAVGAGRQPVQDGQREAGGLAGAGLRRGHQVVAGEHGGDRLLLDGGRRVVALFGDGALDFGHQAKVGKMHGNSVAQRPAAAGRRQNVR